LKKPITLKRAILTMARRSFVPTKQDKTQGSCLAFELGRYQGAVGGYMTDNRQWRIFDRVYYQGGSGGEHPGMMLHQNVVRNSNQPGKLELAPRQQLPIARGNPEERYEQELSKALGEQRFHQQWPKRPTRIVNGNSRPAPKTLMQAIQMFEEEDEQNSRANEEYAHLQSYQMYQEQQQERQQAAYDYTDYASRREEDGDEDNSGYHTADDGSGGRFAQRYAHEPHDPGVAHDNLMHSLSMMHISQLPPGAAKAVDLWQRNKNDSYRNDSPSVSSHRNGANNNAGRIYDSGQKKVAFSTGTTQKTKACDNYMRGSCEKGAGCLWSHDPAIVDAAYKVIVAQAALRSAEEKVTTAALSASRPQSETSNAPSRRANAHSADTQED
jgi:hypothetical protein